MQPGGLERYLTFKTSSKLLTVVGLVWIADFLFYHQLAGWTLGLFGVLLLIAVRIHNKSAANHKYTRIASCAVLGLAFALIESPDLLTKWMYVGSIVALTLLPKFSAVGDVRKGARSVFRYSIVGWLRAYHDGGILLQTYRRRPQMRGSVSRLLKHWLLPLCLSLVFIGLFAEANPIITQWVDKIHWGLFLEYPSASRMVFWLCVTCGCWALIRPKLKPYKPKDRFKTLSKQLVELSMQLFNERSILISLILFNGLFFIQNLMDVVFLWSGGALPEGMSYAQYAHHGAYPLVATALLAAVFVLIALEPGCATERMPVIRKLVYAWVGQNIFLVFSSIHRLVGYIGEYSLTNLRVAALVWMMLVVVGLSLIIFRIYFQKDNKWLVNTNSIMLYAVLYLSCFVNSGGMVAEYNVRHSFEATGSGLHLDTRYLRWAIGVEAIPALLWFEQHHADHPKAEQVRALRKVLQSRIADVTAGWRQWTFRNYRITQKLVLVPAEQDGEYGPGGYTPLPDRM